MNETDDVMTPAETSTENKRLRVLSTIPRQRTVWTPDLILRRILERERAFTFP